LVLRLGVQRLGGLPRPDGAGLRAARSRVDARADAWLRYEQARRSSDLDEQRRLYLETGELARSIGDRDLESDATASLGMMLVFSGLVVEGMAHLDLALAGPPMG
jgi:hypothetical protein